MHLFVSKIKVHTKKSHGSLKKDCLKNDNYIIKCTSIIISQPLSPHFWNTTHTPVTPFLFMQSCLLWFSYNLMGCILDGLM